jgi:deoxyribodipyrimidine photo-lyase
MNRNRDFRGFDGPFLAGEGTTVVDHASTVFWFRRDLRLTDNAGLYYALRENKNIVPLFIFDANILDDLDKEDKRVEFILHSLAEMKSALEAAGTSLLVLIGDPISIFKKLSPKAVYTNDDYEPYARQRDAEVESILHVKRASFHSFKDQVIFEKNEIVKDDRSPYTIFTPYSRKWKSALTSFFLKSYPTARYFKNFARVGPLPFPDLTDLGFLKTGATFPKRIIPQSIIERYDRQRDFPGLHGTTRLSVHLRFGTVSIRVLARLALEKNDAWLNELIWREFYQMILWHFPFVQTRSFKSAYNQIVWRNDADEFLAWCEGRTGYPLVDAGMRELSATGFMHNRVRMVTASFLTKHVLIDWRWGEAWFAKKLLDYDLAANNGGWQWAAGCGCDAAPYFRVFNPQLQMEKFDPDFTYVKKWVPEWGTPSYPKPIVDHAIARERALRVFKVAVDKR